MRSEQWEAVWRVLQASYPTATALEDQTVKVEWATAFGRCEPRLLMGAVREAAKRKEWPSIAGISQAYEEFAAKARENDRVARLTAGPEEAIAVRYPSFDAAYEALDPLYRDELEQRLKGVYPAAYAHRNRPGPLAWAWRCLVVTADADGFDELTGGVAGASDRLREDQRWQANFEATRRQLGHEQNCPRCKQYAAPPGATSTANPKRDRVGAPCAVGRIYWEPAYRLGMERPT